MKYYPKKPCLAPLTSVGITPQGDLRPCCWYSTKGEKFNIKDTSIQEYRENILFPVFEKMKNNEYPVGCSRCLTAGRTRADYYENLYGHERALLEEKKLLRTMDLRLGNTCNISCITCSSYNSSYFFKVADKGYYMFDNMVREQHRYPDKWEENQKNMDQIYNNLQYVDMLYFTGGEPTINNGMRDVLQYCVNNNLTNIKLELNTNCTNANAEFMELIKHFETRWYLSIDALDDLNNIIRYPSKFDALMKNINTFIETKPNDKFFFVPTISIFNFFKLDEYIERIQSFISKHPDRHIKIAESLNVMYQPEWQHVGNIPDNLYSKQIEKIPSPYNKELKSKIKNGQKLFSPSKNHTWEECKELTRNYFESRGFDPKITGIPGI